MNFQDDTDFGMDHQMGQQDLVYQPPEGSNFGPYPPTPQQPHGGPAVSGKEQAIMWQQGHYMGGESGFISASTTQPSSITGHEDDLESAANCYTGPGSITGSSIYDLDSAHVSEVSSIHSSQQHFGLTDPEEFIPKLVGFLCDEDQVVVYAYLNFIERCVRKESFFNGAIRSLDLVGSIVQTLINSTSIMASLDFSNNNNNNNNGDANPDNIQQQREIYDAAEKRAKSAVNILKAMSDLRDTGDHRGIENQRVACQSILTTGGITPLTGLLSCRIDRIMFNAIAALHSLLLCLDTDPAYREAAKNAVREANGVHIMVKLLNRDNVKLLTILTDCLRILSVKNQATKAIILQGNGPNLLVNIMKHKDYKNLIVMTARLLKVLSVCPLNKPAIIQSGGMEALARHLQSDHSKITYHCSWTMRNLSDVATNIENPGHLASELVKLLYHSEVPIIICAAGIISNLTVNNEPLKLAICDADGIRELLRVIDIHGRNHELLEPAMCGLRHLTNNHKKAEAAQRMFIYDLGGLQMVCRWIHPQANRPCLKAALGVIRNLAQKPVNHPVMREKEVVHLILRLLSVYMKNVMAPNGNQVIDNIRWEEIAEGCLSCIFHFSKDGINRTIIRDRSILQNLKSLLGHNSENIQRLSAGILHEISTDMEGAFAIQAEGLEGLINALIHSRNEKIATYATSILYNLTNLKKECERGNFRPPPPSQQQQQQQHPQMMPGPPPLHGHPQGEDRSRGFPPDMGPGFDDIINNPPMHQMNLGPMGGGYPHQQMMGGPPPPHHGGHPPQPPTHAASPQGFMEDLGGDMSMDIEGLMLSSPAYSTNYSQGFFDSGM